MIECISWIQTQLHYLFHLYSIPLSRPPWMFTNRSCIGWRVWSLLLEGGDRGHHLSIMQICPKLSSHLVKLTRGVVQQSRTCRGYAARYTPRKPGQGGVVGSAQSSTTAFSATLPHQEDNILHPDYRGVTNPFIYDDAYTRSTEKTDEFWAAAAEEIIWTKKWDKVLDDSHQPFTKWWDLPLLPLLHFAEM